MKRWFVLLGITLLLFSQCSQESEEMLDDISLSTFSENANEYGKLIAGHIRTLVKDAYNTKEIGFITSKNQINQLALNQVKQLPSEKLSRSTTNQFSHTTKEDLVSIAQTVKSLSEKQLEILKQISNAKQESNSADEFLQKLLEINKNIKENVLEIEQERLLMVTSSLYYTLKEIISLTAEGYLPSSFSRSSQVNSMTKSGESGVVTGPTPGNIGSWCKEGLSTVWLVALAEPSPLGELVATGATLLVGGYLLYQYAVRCITRPSGYTPEECLELYLKCMDLPGEYEGGRCYDCFRYCEAQHEWNC